MKIKISSTAKPKRKSYPLRDLKVGQSFIYCEKENYNTTAHHNASALVSHYHAKTKLKFEAKKDTQGNLRIWRIK